MYNHMASCMGVTHESLCHHHLIPHQFEWEKEFGGMKNKKKGIREKGKGKERKEKGEKRKEPTGFPPTDDASTDGINWTEAP